ncbi:MAG TPA: glutamyl-tRNA reductase [Terriglobia bacterium]|jgi:glutamyl-tRNA reductase|nr:glutamyl-tRNA reductase [Terriglobia bacterium]
MNLALVGINHRTAPVEVRERMSIPESRLREAVRDLVRREGIQEGLILSTCNRVEVVASARDGIAAEPIIRRFLADHHQCNLALYEKHFYQYRQREAIEHLFRVASSLDSMIVGEPQILGQLKQAYNAARDVGALNGTLNEITLRALAVARKVRRNTAIGASAVSVSYAAVELARKIFGDLTGKSILVLGAGKMSEIAARNLIRSGAGAIFVANRTYERAVELAEAFHGTAIRYEQILDHVGEADIIICSTAAPHYVIQRKHAEQWLAARKNRPMFFVDISVPRNIDPSINELDNAFVYDIDDLGQVVEANKKEREREAFWAEQIIQDEVQKTMRRLASREVVPTIVALEQRLEAIRESELERYRGRLGDLTPQQREAIDALTHGILNKVLHGPIQELKSGVGRPEQSSLVSLVRKMFGVVE